MAVIHAGRAGEAVIDRTLVRMQELVDVERIAVRHPTAVQIAPPGAHADIVVGGVLDERVVHAIEKGIEADDFKCRQQVVLGRRAGYEIVSRAQ
jgi:hypothetical protein